MANKRAFKLVEGVNGGSAGLGGHIWDITKAFAESKDGVFVTTDDAKVAFLSDWSGAEEAPVPGQSQSSHPKRGDD